MCKECKEQFIANGNKMFYNSFEGLTNDLKDKFKSDATRLHSYNSSKKGYIGFINKLNKNGDKLIGDYVNNFYKTQIKWGKCRHISSIRPSDYKTGYGCGICDGKIVVKGINDIATTHPQYIKYFVNIEDAYNNTYGSKTKVEVKCPYCGYIKNMSVHTLTSQGFGCNKCSDGISYGEKVLMRILECLNLEYKIQYKFDDNNKNRYDFVICDKIIIEVHGMQHYWYLYNNLKNRQIWNGGFNGIEEHENDLYKYDLAILHGYEYNKNYFIIDARESNISYIKQSIESCIFFKQFNLDNIDWQSIDIEAQSSLKINICNYWEKQKEIDKDLTSSQVADIFKLHYATVVKYLKWGNKNGICIYNAEEESKASKRRQSKFVYLIKPDGIKWYDKAMSQNELARLTGISVSAIRKRREDGKPLGLKGANNIKYDSKYIGSYVVEAK